MTAKTEAPNAAKLASFLKKHAAAGQALKASCEPEGIDLVEEQHARRVCPGLLEDVVEIPLARPDPHVEDVGDADGEESGLDLPCRCPRQVRLAAARRAVHEDPPADPLAVGPVELRMGQRMDDLEADLLLELVHPADVGKPDPRSLDLDPEPAVLSAVAEAAL